MGELEVEENYNVNVKLPHTDGHGATNFKGSAKPANPKDCLLIIDHETGEVRIERVSTQILLKKTRAEKACVDNMNNCPPKDKDDPMNQTSPEPVKTKQPKHPSQSQTNRAISTPLQEQSKEKLKKKSPSFVPDTFSDSESVPLAAEAQRLSLPTARPQKLNLKQKANSPSPASNPSPSHENVGKSQMLEN